jgi:hypothetical protein
MNDGYPEKECCVCYKKFEDNFRPLFCGHYIHVNCCINNKCPLCRDFIGRIIGRHIIYPFDNSFTNNQINIKNKPIKEECRSKK